jgi:hypothetical protein
MGQYAQQAQIQGIGGFQNALNVTAATVVKSSRGTLFTVVVQNPGTSGNLVINDNNALGASNVIGNQILSLTQAQLAAQTRFPLTLKYPCVNGITVSAVPAGSSFAIAFS